MSVSLERRLTYGCPSSCRKPSCFLDVSAVNYVSLNMHYSYSIYSEPTPKNTKEGGKLADSILRFRATSVLALLQFQAESGWILPMKLEELGFQVHSSFNV